VSRRPPFIRDNGARTKQDQLVSARRNNQTVLASQQENMMGSDGNVYGLKNSQTGRKDQRQVSKKVKQNSNLAESNMGNYSDAHAETLTNLKSASTDFSDFLLRQAAWWLAQGWYVAIRKAYIRFGPASQNDKYFVNLANPFPTHRDAVFFLYNVLFCCYNNVRAKGEILDFKLPKHISFAITVLATKQLQRTPTGVIDMATQPTIGITAISIVTTYPTQLAYLNEVVALPAHPFPMTGRAEMESNITVYHDAKGEAIHSTMKLEEIASIYGYFVPNGNPSASRAPKDVFNYDYNGFDHPSSTQVFRSAFFTVQGTDYKPEIELNPQLMNNQFCDPRLVMLNFAATGFIPTSEHTMYCAAEHLSNTGDRVSKYASNAGLSYIVQKIAGGNMTNSVPIAGADFLAYNCALDLAMALQTQVSNFCQIMPTSGTDPSAPFTEDFYSWAVAVAQFVEKIPLPSVIFEEMKNFSDINSWTMIGKPEPTAIYYAYSSIYKTTLSTSSTTLPVGAMTLNNYFLNVSRNMTYMMEIRYWVRMNMAPEINNYMPSVHLMLRDSQNRIYSILDAESFHHKDIAMWLNYSYIPLIPESRPLPLTYVEVKNVNEDDQLLRLYQMAVDTSFQGKSSELDAYYQRLRDKQIGFFAGLSSILGAVLPMVPHLVSAIFKPKTQKNQAPEESTKGTFSTGALVQSMLSALVNQKDFKQIAVNAPEQKRTVKHPVTKNRVLATRPNMRKMLRMKMMRRLGK
jgi:hypothetical protein